MKTWEKGGWKLSGPFRVRFLPDNLTLSNWRFMVCSEIRIVLIYGLGYKHTPPHKHKHTHISTLLPFAPRHGSSCRLWIKIVFLSTFKHAVSQLRAVHCTYKEKSGNESSYTNPCFWHKHTYLLSPWSKVLLEKLTVSQLVKKLPAFYGTRRSITALTSANHLSLSSARSIQSMPPHPTS